MSAKLRIHWITEGLSGDWDKGWSSPLASNRYRVILPATALRASGHEVEFITADRWQWDRSAERPDVIVISKLLPGVDAARYQRLCQSIREQARAACAAGVLVVGDFNDDHFHHPQLGEHWRELSRSVGLCVVGSDPMAATVRRHTTRPIVVVGDPIGSPSGEPKVFSRPSGMSRWAQALLPSKGARRLKFAWYGNLVNWPAMQRWAQQLAPLAATQPFVLWIVTQPAAPIAQFVEAFNAQHGPGALAELMPWDEETQWQTVSDADIVLIPSDPDDPKKAVKTSNRLSDALNAGRYVIASPLPSYAPYNDVAALTDEPSAAVEAYLADSEAALARIRRGQATAQARSGLVSVAAEWGRAFLTQPPPQRATDDAPRGVTTNEPHAEPAAAVRLNLGCGDKILPGYVNVDVVEARAGKQPDVICDLRELTAFESDSADEVLAVHVVEHFWRWEIEDVLREWMRVLKPGGRMVLECPNLQSACEAFLANPDAGSRPDRAGQRTMWVFYGDPQWNDPLMVHRWGYTPRSLAELMESVGLVGARQEPAQYKLREPRDMRVVAEKPLAR